MSFIFNGLKATVSISGAVNAGLNMPSTTQSVVVVANAAAAQSTGYTTFYTVTGGKTFYLTDIILGAMPQNLHSVADNGTLKLMFRDITGSSNQIEEHLHTPIPFTTNVQIKNAVSNTGTYQLTLIGFEA